MVGVGARIGHAQGAPRLLSLLRGPLLLLPPVLVVLLLLLEQLLLLLLEGAEQPLPFRLRARCLQADAPLPHLTWRDAHENRFGRFGPRQLVSSDGRPLCSRGEEAVGCDGRPQRRRLPPRSRRRSGRARARARVRVRVRVSLLLGTAAHPSTDDAMHGSGRGRLHLRLHLRPYLRLRLHLRLHLHLHLRLRLCPRLGALHAHGLRAGGGRLPRLVCLIRATSSS